MYIQDTPHIHWLVISFLVALFKWHGVFICLGHPRFFPINRDKMLGFLPFGGFQTNGGYP